MKTRDAIVMILGFITNIALLITCMHLKSELDTLRDAQIETLDKHNKLLVEHNKTLEVFSKTLDELIAALKQLEAMTIIPRK